MAMATIKVHWNRPIWAASGGAELPVMNIAAASKIILAEPSTYSLDRMFGIRLPRWFALVGLAGVAAAVGIGTRSGVAQPEEPQQEEAGATTSGGEEGEHPA